MEREITQIIALTWAPDQKRFAHLIAPRKQLNEHMKILRALDYSCFYEIYPEFHSNGCLHYHMLINIYDKIKWFRYSLPTLKYAGFIFVKTRVDLNWRQYCRKQLKVTQSTLKCVLPITLKHDLLSRLKQHSFLSQMTRFVAWIKRVCNAETHRYCKPRRETI